MSIIVTVLSLFINTKQFYYFLPLFVINFVVIGLSFTLIFNPLVDFKKLTRNIIPIIGSGLLFTLLVLFISNHAEKLNILLLLGVISIILVIFAFLGQRESYNNKLKEIENYENKSIAGSTYSIIILCLITLISLILPPFNVIPVWYIFAVFFIVFIPGYLITNTIIPYKEEIEFLERWGISVFLCLILAAIFGLILHQIESTINLAHVSLVMVLLTLIIAIPLYINKTRKIPSYKRFKQSQVDKILILVTIIGLIFVIFSGVYVNTAKVSTHKNGTTSFNIEATGGSQGESQYQNFTGDSNASVNMKIANHEYKNVNYTVKEVVTNNSTNKVLNEYNFTLKNNQTKEITDNIIMSAGRKDIQFQLFKNGNSTPIKTKHLYANVL